MKRIFTALVAMLLLVGCGSSGSPEANNKLVIWTFTDEMETMINDYYIPSLGDIDYEIEIVVIPDDQYQTKLDPVLGTKDAPDVILLESASAKKYVESGKMADLNEIGIDSSAYADTFDYVVDIGTSNDGVLRALSWQATPGAFYYRPSLAKELLGVETKEEMQALVSDFDKFVETAYKLNEASNGDVYMVASTNDVAKPLYANRDTGWVKDNKLVIDDALIQLLELARTLVEDELTMDVEGQSEAWFAEMSSDNIFGYFLPTWGLHYWLKPNAAATDGSSSTEGDWAVIEGPTSWFWGGTWVGVTDTSTMKEEAAALVQYVTTNPDFLKSWAKDTGDFVSNEGVVNEIKGDFSEAILGGQNHYELFASVTGNINGSILTEYDLTIEDLFLNNVLGPYSKGEKTLEEVITDFKALVQNAYPDLVVE